MAKASSELTNKDRDAIIAEVTKGMTPAIPRTPSIEERIHLWRDQYLDYRKLGFSWEQLVEYSKAPKIGINTTQSTLKRHVGEKPKTPVLGKPMAGLSKEARDQIFAEATKGKKAAKPTDEVVMTTLLAWRPQIHELKATGFSPEEIVTILAKIDDIRLIPKPKHIRKICRKEAGPSV